RAQDAGLARRGAGLSPQGSQVPPQGRRLHRGRHPHLGRLQDAERGERGAPAPPPDGVRPLLRHLASRSFVAKNFATQYCGPTRDCRPRKERCACEFFRRSCWLCWQAVRQWRNLTRTGATTTTTLSTLSVAEGWGWRRFKFRKKCGSCWGPLKTRAYWSTASSPTAWPQRRASSRAT